MTKEDKTRKYLRIDDVELESDFDWINDGDLVEYVGEDDIRQLFFNNGCACSMRFQYGSPSFILTIRGFGNEQIGVALKDIVTRFENFEKACNAQCDISVTVENGNQNCIIRGVFFKCIKNKQ